MRYYLCSHGVRLGETELAFRVALRGTRSGWLLPTPEGERVLPRISSSFALSARLRGDDGDARRALEREEVGAGSSMLADLAEAAHHQAALALELLQEDGLPVRTTDIFVQDTEQLVQLARLLMADTEDEVELFDPERITIDALDDMELEPDQEDIDDEIFALENGSTWTWTEHDLDYDAMETPAGERYQIHVVFDPEAMFS